MQVNDGLQLEMENPRTVRPELLVLVKLYATANIKLYCIIYIKVSGHPERLQKSISV